MSNSLITVVRPFKDAVQIVRILSIVNLMSSAVDGQVNFDTPKRTEAGFCWNTQCPAVMTRLGAASQPLPWSICPGSGRDFQQTDMSVRNGCCIRYLHKGRGMRVCPLLAGLAFGASRGP